MLFPPGAKAPRLNHFVPSGLLKETALFARIVHVTSVLKENTNTLWEKTMQKRIIRIQKLSEQGTESDLEHTTSEERIGMMWQLALDAWAFKGENVVESRLPRHTVHILRRES